MTFTGFLIRFFFYFLLVYIALVAYIFSPIEYKLPRGLDGLAFGAIVFSLSVQFGKSKGRYFTTRELVIAIPTIFLIDSLFQFFFSGSIAYMMGVGVAKIINSLIVSGIYHLVMLLFALILAKARLNKIEISK